MVAKAEELTVQKKGPEAVAEAASFASIDPQDAIVLVCEGKGALIDSQFEEALACFSKSRGDWTARECAGLAHDGYGSFRSKTGLAELKRRLHM